jgi:hypothetical protein
MPEQDRNIEQARWAARIERRRRFVAEQEAALERRREASRARAAEPRPEPALLAGDDEKNLRLWLAQGGTNEEDS